MYNFMINKLFRLNDRECYLYHDPCSYITFNIIRRTVHTNIYIIYMWKGKQSPAHLFRSDIVRSCYTLILDGKNVKYCIIIIMIHIDNNLRIQMISSKCFGRLKLMQLYFLTRKIPYTIFLWIVFPKCTIIK